MQKGPALVCMVAAVQGWGMAEVHRTCLRAVGLLEAIGNIPPPEAGENFYAQRDVSDMVE